MYFHNCVAAKVILKYHNNTLFKQFENLQRTHSKQLINCLDLFKNKFSQWEYPFNKNLWGAAYR